jgi:hypothetical protein
MATRSQFRLFIFFGCFVRTEYFESLADGRRPDNVLDRVPIKRATELDTTAAPTAERPVPMDVTVSTLVAIRNKVRIILCVCVCVCVSVCARARCTCVQDGLSARMLPHSLVLPPGRKLARPNIVKPPTTSHHLVRSLASPFPDTPSRHPFTHSWPTPFRTPCQASSPTVGIAELKQICASVGFPDDALNDVLAAG